MVASRPSISNLELEIENYISNVDAIRTWRIIVVSLLIIGWSNAAKDKIYLADGK